MSAQIDFCAHGPNVVPHETADIHGLNFMRTDRKMGAQIELSSHEMEVCPHEPSKHPLKTIFPRTDAV